MAIRYYVGDLDPELMLFFPFSSFSFSTLFPSCIHTHTHDYSYPSLCGWFAMYTCQMYQKLYLKMFVASQARLYQTYTFTKTQAHTHTHIDLQHQFRSTIYAIYNGCLVSYLIFGHIFAQKRKQEQQADSHSIYIFSGLHSLDGILHTCKYPILSLTYWILYNGMKRTEMPQRINQ